MSPTQARFPNTLLLALAMLVAAAGSAAAAGLPFSGELADGDAPASGAFDMLFEVHDAPEAGTLLWSDTFTDVVVVEGRFQVTLGADGSLEDVLDGRGLWVAMTVEGDALAPRLPLGRVAHAAFADRADALSPSGVTTIETQLREGELLAGLIERLERLEDGFGGEGTDASDLAARVAALEAENAALAGRLAALEAESDGVENALGALDGRLDAAEEEVSGLQALLSFIERVGTDVYFDGVNVHIRSGAGPGSFDGVTGLYTQSPAADVGNLILGYNELPPASAGTPVRSGSHNLVVGPGHAWNAHASIVAGQRSGVGEEGERRVTGAAVLGGLRNEVTASHAVALGGSANRAENTYAVALGGSDNQATALHAVAVGGNGNRSEASHSVAVGGNGNRSTGDRSVVVGGDRLTAAAANSVVP